MQSLLFKIKQEIDFFMDIYCAETIIRTLKILAEDRGE